MSSGQTVGQQAAAAPLLGRAIMFDVLKGGYGKSTLSVNLADRIAADGYDVLYLDLDPNGHITSSLGFDDVYNDTEHDYGYVVSDKGWYSKADFAPEDLIYETDWGWDFVPSYSDMEAFNDTLKQMDSPSQVLSNHFLRPLFENGKYDFAVMDGGGERSKIADNGFVAGRRAIVPVCPGDESISAVKRTWERVIDPLSDRIDEFELLALVPNLLSERIDYQTSDRVLLERLNTSERFKHTLPEFARITEDEFDRIDNGDYDVLPGVRKNSAISDALGEGMPVAHYDPECSAIEYFDTLATLVTEQEVVQNGR